MERFTYRTPPLVNRGSERDVETRFLLECLHGISGHGRISVLDVGFAGSGYIEDVRAIPGINYTGMDSNAKRIRGDTLRRTDDGKAVWRKTMKKTRYVIGDVLKGTHKKKYDVVMSISMIEHVVPLGYGIRHEFDPNLDMKAVKMMKGMATERLILTFPCGAEKKYCERDSPALIPILRQNGFVVCRHGLIIYDECRYRRVVGDWITEREAFFVNRNGTMREVPRAEAFAYEHRDSFVKAVCGVMMRRPS